MAGTGEAAPRIDRAEIQRRIERLELSADLKVLLSSLVDMTVEIGGKLIDVGGRILTFTFELAKAYPGVTFGVLTALVLSYLVGSIPVLGPVLSPALTPLLLIIGIGLGALNDLAHGPMRQQLSNLRDQLQSVGLS